jgi:hypothetical protein
MGPGTELASNCFGVDSGGVTQRPGVHEVTGLKAELQLLRYPSESTDVKMELGVLICSKQPTTHSWLLVIWRLATGNHEDHVEKNRDFIN